MAVLRRHDLINRYNQRQTTLLSDSGEVAFAKGRLIEAGAKFSRSENYDVFLSHSYDDARVVKVIKEMLEDLGFKVYVDWIEDEHLDRETVTSKTASVLRGRMDRCSSLIYLTSQSAESSVWMPWELGYMDAKTRKVAVAPILDDDEGFEGREYLGLYPYVDLTSGSFYVHNNIREWVGIRGWMEGQQPTARI